MAAIITGNHGTLAYWDASPMWGQGRPIRSWDAWDRPEATGFARLSAFATNGNHAPSHLGGAITADAGIDLLFRIAGKR